MTAPGSERTPITVGACVIGFNAAVPCLTMDWKAYEPGAGFRQANEAILQLLIRSGEARLLGDMEAVVGVTPSDAAWLGEDWIPRAAAAGLRAAALITSAFELGHAPVLLVGERVRPLVRLQYFGDRQAAETWLGSAV